MGNKITDNLRTGTVGELLVQSRLLEHDIQAAPPLKDSGNDLVAVKGRTIKLLQVKTRTGSTFDLTELTGKIYDIVALVKLVKDNDYVYLDKSEIFLLTEEQIVGRKSISISKLNKFRLENVVENIWEKI